MGIVLSTLSQLMYASEKIIACFTCTMLISCLITTFIVILTLGIGLGYNYCFVDMKTRHRYVPSGYRYPGGPRHPYNYHNRPMNWPRARQDEHSDYSLPPFQITEEALLPNLTNDTITEHLEPTDGDTTDSNTSVSNETSTLKTTKAHLNLINSTNDTHIVNGTNSDNLGNTINNTGIVNGTNSDYHGNTMNNTDIVNDTSIDNTGNITITTKIVNSTSIDNPGKMGINGEVNNNTHSELIESVKTEHRPMIIPISGLDLIALLSKLRSENRNYSLQIVTT